MSVGGFLDRDGGSVAFPRASLTGILTHWGLWVEVPGGGGESLGVVWSETSRRSSRNSKCPSHQ